jgi:hypothetical protein
MIRRKTIGRFRCAILGAVAAVGLGGSADATVLRAFDRAEQVHGSSLIATGRVLSVHSFWDAPGEMILTDAEIALDELWKGTASTRTVTVRTLGGSVDGIGVSVSGAATFREGEAVLLFLAPAGGVYRTFGLSVGKYRIVDSPGGRFLVGPPAPNHGTVPSFTEVSLPIENLRGEVERLVAAEGGA